MNKLIGFHGQHIPLRLCYMTDITVSLFSKYFYSDLPAVLQMVQQKGVTIYAVGVGSTLFKDQLIQIAGNHDERVFELDDFSSLSQIIPELDFQLNAGR